MNQRPPIALSRKELYRRVWSEPLTTVGKDLGLSSNALAKICNRLLVPYPTRGYWVKVAAGKRPGREPLPAAPEKTSNQIVISTERPGSRRARTRLDRTSDQSPEQGWIRTWLDTVLELPWGNTSDAAWSASVVVPRTVLNTTAALRRRTTPSFR